MDKCYNGVLASCLKKDVYLNSADKFYYYYYYDFTTNFKNALNRVKQTNIKTEYEIFSLEDDTTLYYLYDNKQGDDFTKNIYNIETQNSIISFVTNAEILPLRFKELIIEN